MNSGHAWTPGDMAAIDQMLAGGSKELDSLLADFRHQIAKNGEYQGMANMALALGLMPSNLLGGLLLIAVKRLNDSTSTT